MKKKMVIIGAGPAGLTAAYELLKATSEYDVIILEQSKMVGGIAKTVSYHGNRMDLGGHRFFSKDTNIKKIWKELLPLEQKESESVMTPEKMEEIMLLRDRISRIYYQKSFSIIQFR